MRKERLDTSCEPNWWTHLPNHEALEQAGVVSYISQSGCAALACLKSLYADPRHFSGEKAELASQLWHFLDGNPSFEQVLGTLQSYVHACDSK